MNGCREKLPEEMALLQMVVKYFCKTLDVAVDFSWLVSVLNIISQLPQNFMEIFRRHTVQYNLPTCRRLQQQM